MGSVYEQLSVSELTVDTIIGGGIVPFVRKKIFLDPTYGSDGNNGLSYRKAKKTLAAAYAMLESGHNDTIFVVPGTSPIVLTAEFTWAKSYCNWIGLGNPNMQGRYVPVGGITPDMSPGCTVYTATVGVASTLHVTGARNQFWNLLIANAGVSALNLTALHLGACGSAINTAYGNYFKNCNFQGGLNTTQNAINTSSITIGSGASYYMFEDCLIGHDTYGGARSTAYAGHVLYEGENATGGAQAAGYGPQDGVWRRCRFTSRGSTVTVPMIHVGGGTAGEPTSDEAMDRTHWFIDCLFTNWFGAAPATVLTTVFDDACQSWHDIRVINSSYTGYDQWRAVRGGQSNGYLRYSTNMAAATASAPGEGLEPTS